MVIRSITGQACGYGQDRDRARIAANGLGQLAQLRRREAEPEVRALTHALVAVRCVVEDDQRPARRTEREQLAHQALRLRRVVQQAHREHRVRARPAPPHHLLHVVAAQLALDELHVAVAAPLRPRPRHPELRRGAIHRDHAPEQRRHDIEQPAVAGAGIDRELARPDERSEQRKVRPDLGGQRVLAARARDLEVLTCQRVAGAQHLGDAGQAAVGLAQRPPALHRIGDHHIGARRRVQQSARALPADPHQTGLAKRRDMARDVRLALIKELRELADGQLLFADQRQEAQPNRLGKDSIELPARRTGSGTRSLRSLEGRDALDGCRCWRAIAYLRPLRPPRPPGCPVARPLRSALPHA